MTKYKVYKLKNTLTDDESNKTNEYEYVKDIELNDNCIESKEELDGTYYRVAMTSGKTYIIGK